MQKFLWCSELFSNILSRFANLVETHNSSDEKGIPFQWGKEQEEAFKEVSIELAHLQCYIYLGQ